ncbi:MAG: hypothetical protein M1835_002355, partial [Candelina submexicana]
VSKTSHPRPADTQNLYGTTARPPSSPVAIFPEAMQLCKALTFASAVPFYPSPYNFFSGYAYAWSRKSHDLLAANLTELKVTLIYVDGCVMGFGMNTLSQLSGYAKVWPDLFPDATWF